MNATELRIGNLFIEQSSKEIISVVGLEKNRVVFSGMFLEKWQAEPIPLTEEWLLKFGFEHRDFSFDRGSFFLSKRTGKNEYLYQAHTNRFQVKYVHQLQNLYFSLTAVELTVA